MNLLATLVTLLFPAVSIAGAYTPRDYGVGINDVRGIVVSPQFALGDPDASRALLSADGWERALILVSLDPHQPTPPYDTITIHSDPGDVFHVALLFDPVFDPNYNVFLPPRYLRFDLPGSQRGSYSFATSRYPPIAAVEVTCLANCAIDAIVVPEPHPLLTLVAGLSMLLLLRGARTRPLARATAHSHSVERVVQAPR